MHQSDAHQSIANLWYSYTTTLSSNSMGSGKFSREALLNENEFSSSSSLPSVPCDLALLFQASDFPDVGMTSQLWYLFPWKAKRQELRDEVLLSWDELERSSSRSRTTLSGFSSAFRTYRASGRRVGFGFRHVFAMMATAHTSSRWSSSTTREGSTIPETPSLSLASI